MNCIAGIVAPKLVQMSQTVHSMLNSEHHRCTTPFYIYSHKNIQIGGCQSATAFNKAKSIFCAIDGEINNCDSLAKDLNINSSISASELLIKAYEAWGKSFLKKITGNFALVIVDQTKQQVILGRDRIGIKPLYWFDNNKYFIFASELKSLLATGIVPQTAAMDSLASYLYLGYIPQDMSAIEGVNKLLPAHFLQYNFDGTKFINSYWSYSSHFVNVSKSSSRQIVETLDHHLRKEIKQSLPQNPDEIGCLVSGGLGSATIAYYLKNEIQNNNFYAYSVGFSGEADSEADVEATRLLTDFLKIPHDAAFIKESSFIDDLVKINWYLDEPIADPLIINTWKLSQIASSHSKTVYSGMGCDELFAGHSRYTTREHRINFIKQLFQFTTRCLQKILIPFFQLFYQPLAFQLIKKSRTSPLLLDYLEHTAVFSKTEFLSASPKLAKIFDPEVFLHKFYRIYRIPSNVSSLLYFDVKTRLVDCYIHQFERLTRANSLNWKAPFLSQDIVEYMASLPEPNALEERKAAFYLKSLVKDILPRQIVDRPKRTRQHFLKQWIENEQLRNLYKKLSTGTLVDNGLISSKWINNQIESLRTDHSGFRRLWSVLQLEIWFRLFINRPIKSAPPDLSVFELLEEPA